MKNKHYYNGQLIVTSKTTYKYALLERKKDGGYFKMNVGNNYESLVSKMRYYTAGYGKEVLGSGLWSSQFHNPADLIIVNLEVSA